MNDSKGEKFFEGVEVVIPVEEGVSLLMRLRRGFWEEGMQVPSASLRTGPSTRASPPQRAKTARRGPRICASLRMIA